LPDRQPAVFNTQDRHTAARALPNDDLRLTTNNWPAGTLHLRVETAGDQPGGFRFMKPWRARLAPDT
jgi:hypothetical protein